MIKFYSINHDYNTVNKLYRKSSVLDLNINLLKETDRLNPELLIYSENNLELVNYCYISDFKRYYYIEKVKQIRKNLYRLNCKVDVLETYKIAIMNAKDIEFINSVKVVHSIVNATETKPKKVSYILNTIGG